MASRLFILTVTAILSCATFMTRDQQIGTQYILQACGMHSPWNLGYQDSTWYTLHSKNDSLYFAFDVKDSTQTIRIQDKFHHGIAHSDRVELFFATDTLLTRYYGLELGSDCRIFDFEGFYPDSINYNWSIPRNQLSLSCNHSMDSYQVAGSISLNYLNTLNLIRNNTLILGLFRADYTRIDDVKAVTWLTWKVPSTPQPQFHTPSAFNIISLEVKHD